MKFYEYFDAKYLCPIPKYKKELRYWNKILINDCNEELVFLSGVSDKIIVEPQYYLDNIAGSYDGCMVRVTIKNKLVKISEKLPDGYFLKIWDGFRTVETQQSLFDKYYSIFAKKTKLEGEALLEYTKKFVSLPSYDVSNPSPHNTGAVVDLTICDSNGKSIELGTYFDDFEEKSYTRYYEELLESGRELTELEKEILYNRRILCNLFEEAGFLNYPYEIWHKSYGDQMYCELCSGEYANYGSAEIE